VIVPTSDVNIDFERRSKASYTGFAMVTSIAHVWFNAYFEGGAQYDSGVFETEWDALDGIKGSAQKGIRAIDRLKVVWRYPPPSGQGPAARPISEPKPGEPVSESHPADWRGQQSQEQGISSGLPTITTGQENQPPPAGIQTEPSSEPARVQTSTNTITASEIPASAAAHLLSVGGLNKELGLRKQTDESKDVSLAGSEDERERTEETQSSSSADLEGVRSYFEKTGLTEQKKDGGEEGGQ
jgi:protein-tyrosine phosphatase